MKILRVFPRKTNYTPDDELVCFGPPGLFIPNVEEVHISVTFSWDISRALWLYESWDEHRPSITKIGGPAWKPNFDKSFSPGLYIKRGITFTTRGCNFNCPWCLVPKIEGNFREIPINKGNIIQDNNILLASKEHLQKVFNMLKKEKAICFKGGIDCMLLKDWHIENMRSLKIKEIWMALDSWNKKKYFEDACKKLINAGFKRNNIRAYILAGFNEPIIESESRLRFAYECGSLPFVQLYQDKGNKLKRKEEIKFIRSWSRPAAIKAMVKG